MCKNRGLSRVPPHVLAEIALLGYLEGTNWRESSEGLRFEDLQKRKLKKMYFFLFLINSKDQAHRQGIAM